MNIASMSHNCFPAAERAAGHDLETRESKTAAPVDQGWHCDRQCKRQRKRSAQAKLATKTCVIFRSCPSSLVSASLQVHVRSERTNADTGRLLCLRDQAQSCHLVDQLATKTVGPSHPMSNHRSLLRHCKKPGFWSSVTKIRWFIWSKSAQVLG